MDSVADGPPVGSHVPTAVYAVVAAAGVLAANVALMAIWWWRTNGTDSQTTTVLAAVLAGLLLGSALGIVIRHRSAKPAAVWALALSLLADAVLVGWDLTGST
jgi:uncharacterized membrane protein YfcA